MLSTQTLCKGSAAHSPFPVADNVCEIFADFASVLSSCRDARRQRGMPHIRVGRQRRAPYRMSDTFAGRRVRRHLSARLSPVSHPGLEMQMQGNLTRAAVDVCLFPDSARDCSLQSTRVEATIWARTQTPVIRGISRFFAAQEEQGARLISRRARRCRPASSDGRLFCASPVLRLFLLLVFSIFHILCLFRLHPLLRLQPSSDGWTECKVRRSFLCQRL